MYDSKNSIKSDLESKYEIKIRGGWNEDELLLLGEALDKTAAYAGGAENLNDVILDGIDPKYKGYKLVFKNVGGGEHDPPCGNAYACFDPKSDTILVSDYIFTAEYQRDRQKQSSRSLGVQISFIHEIVHVFTKARPAMVGLYGGFVDNPNTIHHQPGPDCMNECIHEENMATTIAKYVVTGNITTPDQLQFVLQTQHYWHSGHKMSAISKIE